MRTDARGLHVTRLDATLATNEDGAISVLGVLGAAAFACLLLLVINTGWTTSGKIEMQNAADASAISGATWVARGLNVISLSNVTSAQILAIVVIIEALDEAAIDDALWLLDAQRKACRLATPWCTPFLPILELQYQSLEAFRQLVKGVEGMAEKGSGLLWQAMMGLQRISRVVRDSFVLMGVVEGDRVARQNGAALGAMIPAHLDLKIPVREGAMRSDLCNPARERLGRYSGPLNLLFIAWVNSLIHVWFYAAKETHFQALCGGSTGAPPEGNQVDSLRECRREGGGKAYWGVVRYDIETSSPETPDYLGPPETQEKPLETSCDWPNPFFNGRSYRVIQNPVFTGTEEQPRFRHRVTDYSLLSVNVRSEGGENKEALPQGAANSDEPNPLMLKSTARDDLKYLAVVYRQRTGAAAPAYFSSALGTHRLAYAQARVYNPVGFDTFTQEWRVALEPASLLERATTQGGGSTGAAQSSLFQQLLQSVPFLRQWGQDVNMLRFLNNH